MLTACRDLPLLTASEDNAPKKLIFSLIKRLVLDASGIDEDVPLNLLLLGLKWATKRANKRLRLQNDKPIRRTYAMQLNQFSQKRSMWSLRFDYDASDVHKQNDYFLTKWRILRALERECAHLSTSRLINSLGGPV